MAAHGTPCALGGIEVKANSSGHYMTTREACDRLGYSRPDSFLRAWRAAGLPVYQRPSGRNLVAWGDLERFVRAITSTDRLCG